MTLVVASGQLVLYKLKWYIFGLTTKQHFCMKSIALMVDEYKGAALVEWRVTAENQNAV